MNFYFFPEEYFVIWERRRKEVSVKFLSNLFIDYSVSRKNHYQTLRNHGLNFQGTFTTTTQVLRVVRNTYDFVIQKCTSK